MDSKGPPTRLQLLGPVRADAGGPAVRLGGVKSRGVLALLALHSPHSVAVPELSRWIWGEEPPPSATATLQAYVSRLRAVLGPRAVVGERHAYRLGLDPRVSDVHRFRDLLRRARAASEHDAREAAELLEAALAQWQGPALADLQELPAAAAVALDLERERLEALELLLGLRLRLGQHQLALPRLLQLVREHPHDEQLARHLMLALYRSGRQGEALEVYARLRGALVDELGVEPAPQTRDLHAALLRHDDALLPVAPHGNLPLATTSFVGRRRELAELPALLLRERVVALTGPSGSGKTRLALEVARRLRPADGAWLVDLTAARDAGTVLRAVTAALGVQEQPGVDPLETLVAAVGERDLLLVADGCDAGLGDCVALLTVLTTRCARLRALLTCVHPATVPLTCRQVGPLPVPGPGEDGDDDAVALLLARTHDSSAPDLEPLRRLARGTGGLPLHLELAAARLDASSADELVAELAQRGGAVLEWSLAARHADDRRLLTRLAVFPTGFDAGAATVVAAGPVDQALTSLASAGLLFTERQDDGLRYRVPDAVAAALPAPDDDAAGRLAAVCLELVDRAGSRLRTPASAQWMARLDLEQASIRSALRWTLASRPDDALRLVGGLGWYWFRRARISEGRGFVDAALAGEGTSAARSAAHLAGACLSYHAGDLPALQRHTRQGLVAARAGGEGPAARLLLLAAWHAALALGLEPARAFAQQARLEAEGEPEVLAEALLTLGMIARFSGEPEAARELLEQSRDVGTAAGNSWAVGSALWIAAKVALEQGQPHEAHRLYAESLRLAVTDDDVASALVNLHGIAGVAAVTGNPERGAELLGAVAAAGERIGYDPVRMDPLDGPRDVQAVRSALDDDAWEGAVARGRALAFPAAAALGYAALRPTTS